MATKPKDSPWQALPAATGGLSNCDFTVDDGVEDQLRAGHHCEYTGWNFCGYVWFADGRFHCEVWTRKLPREVVSAETLDALMHAVSGNYGYD